MDQYFAELENVKLRLKLAAEDHAGAPEPAPPKRDLEAVQLTTSNVPSINWAELGSSPTLPQAQTLDLGFPDDVSSLTDNFQRLGTSLDLLTGPAPAAAAPLLPTFQTQGYFLLHQLAMRFLWHHAAESGFALTECGWPWLLCAHQSCQLVCIVHVPDTCLSCACPRDISNFAFLPSDLCGSSRFVHLGNPT